jgi:GNAT superfamily N-acetyltransferase
MPNQTNDQGNQNPLHSVLAAIIRSRRTEILILILGLLGYIVFFSQYDRVFPSAALQLDLSRKEIAEKAQTTLAEYGYDVTDYKFALIFSSGNTFYLERMLGIPAANELIKEENLPVWHWHARWFKPLQEEEFTLDLAPDGRVIGFNHHIPEAETAPTLEVDQAQAKAESYLNDQIGWNLRDWELVSSSSSEQLGGRIDHNFQWKRGDFEAGESELRVSVGLQGDTIGHYNYWLKTPDAFWRAFSEKANIAGTIDWWSTMIGDYGLTFVAIVAVAFLWVRGVRIWRQAAVAVLLAAGLRLATSLNYLPLAKNHYGTTQVYSLFWIERLVNIAFSTMMFSFYLFLTYLGARALNKIVWPGEDKILPRHPSRWVALSESSWRGLKLAGIKSAYVIGFYYLVTNVLGGWSPMSVSYSNTYATPLPFLYPLRSGLLAGLDEELIFRLIGIAFLLWLTRRKWLAVLLPGALWALAHLTYIRDPFYMRGVELLAVGLFYGFIFLKYDLVTTIMAHAVYNALLGALPMLRSGEPYFVFSGTVILVAMFVPILPGWILTLRRWIRSDGPFTRPHIRPAKTGDREALRALLPEDIALGPESVIRCLEHEGDLVGAAVGVTKDQTEGEIICVYVQPDWRRQYWGSRLVLALKEALKEHGVETITVQVDTNDREANPFWAAQGWQPTRKTYAQARFPSPKSLLQQMWATVRGKA